MDGLQDAPAGNIKIRAAGIELALPEGLEALRLPDVGRPLSFANQGCGNQGDQTNNQKPGLDASHGMLGSATPW